MPKKEQREGEILAYILSSMDEGLECETDFSNLPSMGRTTAFSVMKGMGELVEHRGNARYRLRIPKRALQEDVALVEAMDKTIQAMYLIRSAAEKLLPYSVQRLKERYAICSKCEHYEKCMNDEEVECPAQFKIEPVQNWTGVPDLIRKKRDQEEEASSKLNWESLEVSGSGDHPEEEPPPTPPTDRGRDARKLLRDKLEESKRAQEDRPPSMRQQVRELRACWEEGMKAKYGADFYVPPWGPKEFKLAPKLIGENNLELTKKALRLYLESWDKIRAENAWISETTPTFGFLWHFRDMVFSAVQGKGAIGGRASKRTADECHDDEDYTGGWPDDGEEASSSPA